MASLTRLLPGRHQGFAFNLIGLLFVFFAPVLLWRFVSPPLFFLPMLAWWQAGATVINPIQRALGFDLFKHEEFGLTTRTPGDETLTFILISLCWLTAAIALALLMGRGSAKRRGPQS